MKHYYKQAFQALILIIVLTQTSCKKASQEEPITQTEAITPELKTKEINPGENHLKDVEQPVVINNTQSKATRQLIIYQPSTRYQHKDYGYVKGQVSGQGFETAQIYISGEKASPRSGYFEQLAKRTTGNPTGDWKAEIKAIFTDGDTLITYADFSNNNLGEEQKDIPLEIKELTPESQTTLSYSSATLYIEPGAVKEKKTISVSPLEEEEMSLLSPQLSNITQTHTGYRFLPDGTKFEKELTLTIGYDKSKIPFGYGPQDIYTYYYDETRKSWIQLERDSIDEQKQIVYSRTDHFTDYINGILKTPETSDAMAYTPTSIKDLEAAQPLNGITMMSPPQANNKGTANLSYPITIPQGRRGMQPDLNITYNSSGGNGWLGLGWDLSISSITVETRWGVPYYDPNKESETYLLDGETLVTGYYDTLDDGNIKFRMNKPNYRNEWEYRDTSGFKQFYPRVEGSFRKIIRHGTNPQDYWWEVIDKSGTRYFYGKKKEIDSLSVDKNSVFGDYHGNIGRWYLTEVRDVYGNNITYNYYTYREGGQNALQDYARQIHLSNINYTGFRNEEGKYNIDFIIDTSARSAYDVTSSGRYGSKEINKCLLNKIEISYENSHIKTYYFGYKEGAFNKTLLCNFYETDTAIRALDFIGLYERCADREELSVPNPLITHKFEYDSLGSSLYTDEFNLSTGDIDPKWGIFSGNLGSKLSNIGGSSGTSTTKGGNLNIGFGSDPVTKWLTVGGNYSYELGEDRGNLTLMDINGDGYPDKIFRIDDEIRFILQKPYNDGELSSSGFSSTRTTINRSITNFLYTENTTRPWGFNASASLSSQDQRALGSLSGGVVWGSTKTSSSTFFSDVNGDGLVDIIVKGQIFINRLNEPGINGFINETTKDTIFSGGSCGGYVLNDTPVDPSIYGDQFDTVGYWDCYVDKEGKEQCIWRYDTVRYIAPTIYYPNIEAVRVWVAPYNGKIRIESQPRIPEDVLDHMKITQTGDGLRVSIQKSGPVGLLMDFTLDTNTSTVEMNHSGLNVKRGDKIFFRMESLDKRIYDKVIWDPKIIYDSIKNSLGVNISTGLNRIDGNKDSIFRFKASEDFALGSQGDIVQSYVGGLLLIKPKILVENSLTEPLEYKIYKNGSIVIKKTIPKNTIVDINHSINRDTIISISKNDSLRAELTCFGRVKWPYIRAGVEMSIIQSDNDTIQDIIDTLSVPGDTIYTLTYKPRVYRNIYQYSKIPSVAWQSNYSGQISIKPKIFPNVANNYKLKMTIKDENGLVDTFTFTTPINISKSVNVVNGKKYYIDYYTESELGEIIDSISSEIKYGLTTIANASGLYTNYIEEDYSLFGALYRGWGQFGYKPQDSNMNYIDTTLLVLNIDTTLTIDSTTQIDITSNNPESTITNGYNPLSGNFFVAQADDERNYWIPYGNINYFCKDTMANIFKDEEIDIDTTLLEADNPIPFTTTNPKPKVANKESFSEPKYNYNVNTGLDLDLEDIDLNLNLSQGSSYNEGKLRVTSEMMDVNGDGYPDIVSGARVMFSKPRGGLSGKTMNHMTINKIEADELKYSGSGTSGGAQVIKVIKESGNGLRNAKLSMGGASSGSHSDSKGGSTWLDINGDGLPDKITSDNKVYLNYGYVFSRAETWNSNGVRVSKSNSLSLNQNTDLFGAIKIPKDTASFNVVNGSLSGGFGVIGGVNFTEKNFQDINGDGLNDIVYLDGEKVKVLINKGTEFNSTSITLLDDGNIDRSLSLGANINGGISLGGTCGFFKIVGGVSRYKGWNIGLNKSQWIDMNNDGYLDYVTDGSDDNIKVRYSLIGKANILKKVITPTRTNIDINYQLSASNTTSPQRHWQMISTKVYNYDDYDPNLHDTIYTTYKYKNRYYDRYEREDYGYDSVLTTSYLTNSTPYRTNIEVYHNDNYMFKGIKYKEILADSQHRKIHENIYDFRAKDRLTGNVVNESLAHCSSDAYPAINEETVRYYLLTGDTSAQIIIKRAYTHGAYGNITRYSDYGDITTSSDDIFTDMHYYEDTAVYIVNKIYDFYVKSDTMSNTTLRGRSASINPLGDIEELSLVIDGNSTSTYNYKYDQYGNIVKRISSANSTGQRLTTQYQYDTVLHCLPILIQDSNLGYQSSATYNYKWASPIETIDIGGSPKRYTYDRKGRIAIIQGPKEIASGYPYTIKYEYSDLVLPVVNNIYSLRRPWARTLNIDPSDTSNTIKTVAFIDGLQRLIQVKKDIDIASTKYMSVSGRVIFDNLGRVIKNYQSIKEDLDLNSQLLDTVFCRRISSTAPTQTEYDILDRPIQITYPDHSTTQNTYSFGPDHSSANRFTTRIIDQNGKRTRIYADHRGLKTQIISANGATTKFVYDALGQLTQSEDPETHITSYEYDMLGRRTKRTHPSAGETQWQYDPAGNLTKQIMSSGESIDYTYNYNQLTNVSYSDRHWNNVWYEYGGAGSGNQTGRLIKQQDATGVQEFEYGNMGEMIRNRHTYIVPNSEPFTLTTEWEYDSWNRVKQIIYPDKETVTYGYNLGGLLKHVEGNKPSIGQTIYIDSIVYDKYEQRTAVYNGNQTRTYYTYDSVMRRMTNLKTENTWYVLLDIQYDYDPIGNITKIENTGLSPYVQNYTYDNNNQLSHADGNYGGQVSYDLTMQYSPSGRILNKSLSGDKYSNWISMPIPISYDNAYTYGVNGNPYALKQIIDTNTGQEHYFNWDVKGNMIYHKNDNGERRLCWTEDNRMQGMSDRRNGAWYNYDATGERNLKLTGQTMHVNQNGQDYYTPIFDQQTLYANPLITINDKGYTKHYFEEGKRICSKIGSGGLIEVGNIIEGISQGIEEIRDLQKEGVERTFDMCMQLYPYIKTNNLHKTVVKPYEGQINPGEPIFYYHSDHLGSASFLTDTNGIETQELVYLPFGEDWVDMKYNTSQYDTPYKFNGKEKDEETGYNNYGARYYYDWASIWLSVDPMSDKYPSLTSYNYCANNPIMLIDPDGRSEEPVFSSKGDYRGTTKEGYTGDILIYDGTEEFKDLSAEELLEKGAQTYDNMKNYPEKLSEEARIKIWSHILDYFDGIKIGENKFDRSSIKDIKYDRLLDVAWLSRMKKKLYSQILTGGDNFSYEATVENLASSLIVHENIGHALLKATHKNIYSDVLNPAVNPFYSKTTAYYKLVMKDLLDKQPKPEIK